MWRFYWMLIRRAPKLLWTSVSRIESIGAILATAVIFVNRPLGEKLLDWETETAVGFSRWWAAVPIVLLFLHALLKANYERFSDISSKLNEAQEEKKQLSDQIENVQRSPNRILHVARVRLRTHADEGAKLVAGGIFGALGDTVELVHDARTWRGKAEDLLREMIGEAEVSAFRQCVSVNPKPLPLSGKAPSSVEEEKQRWVSAIPEYVRRLKEVAQQLTSDQIRVDFNPGLALDVPDLC